VTPILLQIGRHRRRRTTDCFTAKLQISLTWGGQMSLKHSSGKYKVGLTVIHEWKTRTGAESWWLARGTSGSRGSFLDLCDTGTTKALVSALRRAQALVVCLAVLSYRLRKDPEIQHPLTAGRRHCRRWPPPPGCYHHPRPTLHCRLLDWQRAIQRSNWMRVYVAVVIARDARFYSGVVGVVE